MKYKTETASSAKAKAACIRLGLEVHPRVRMTGGVRKRSKNAMSIRVRDGPSVDFERLASDRCSNGASVSQAACTY